MKYSQKDNFKLSIDEQVRIENEVKQMASGINQVYYIIFAKEVVKAAKKHKGETLIGELEILQDKWSGRGLDVEIMNKIKKYYVPSYKVKCDEYTKLLLHCDGTDGSTIFIDSSNYAHVITANDDAQIDTAQSKFGGASALFDGDGDYLSVPDSDDWTFGTENFTIDTWFMIHSGTKGGIVSQGVDDFHWWGLYYGLEGAGTIGFFYCNGGAETYIEYYCSWTPTVDTWYHISFSRYGSGAYLFINGISQTLTNAFHTFSTTSLANFAGSLYIGARYIGYPGVYLNGWIDEFRISKGKARWTEDFTPPNAPYC